MSNEKKQFTDEEIAEWGEDVLYPKIIELTDPKEIEEAKILSQVVTSCEFKELD